MSNFHGTPISEKDYRRLMAESGRIVDQFNDRTAGVIGTAFESGLRVWKTPQGPRLESPASMEQALHLLFDRK